MRSFEKHVISGFVISVFLLLSMIHRPSSCSADQVTVAFQQGVTPTSSYSGCSDNHLTNVQNPDYNLGGMDSLQFYRGDSATTEYRTLIKFDLSSIPQNAVIVSASLDLYRYASNYGSTNMPVSVHRLTRDWVEGTSAYHGASNAGSSWNEAADGVLWTTPGGDFDVSVITGTTLTGFVQAGWISWDIRPAVQAWVTGSSSNNGVLMRISDSSLRYSSEYLFYSRNYSNAALRPRLVVTYSTDGAANLPPTANAGQDQSINEGTQVSLSGSGTDPESGILTYQWSQVSGTAVTLNNPNTASASFAAPQVNQSTSLTFRLIVTDNGALTATDDVVINVQNVVSNQPPFANAGADIVVNLGAGQSMIQVTLNGSGSSDPDGTISTYTWTGNPNPADVMSPAVSLAAGNYTFSLVVTDNLGASSAADTVAVTVLSPSVGGDQASGLAAFHRSGQTFVTWSEVTNTSGEKYRVYRYSQPITTANLAQATLIATIDEGSSEYDSESARSGARVNYVIQDRGQAISNTTGLHVHTSHDAGNFYYAVTSVVNNSENTTISSSNAVGPFAEMVADPKPVLMRERNGGTGRTYTQWMDYATWNPTFDGGYAYNYSVSIPSGWNRLTPLPMFLQLEGWGSRYSEPDMTPYGWQAIHIWGDDWRQTWYYGFSATYDYRLGGSPNTGPIVNYTEQQIMRSIYDTIRNSEYPVDVNRVYAYGNSMGASGVLALGLRYPNVFAAVYCNQPMTNYAASAMWIGDVTPKWGTVQQNLPIENRGVYAADLVRFNGTGVFDWQNHQAQFIAQRGRESTYITALHGMNDTTIDWATEGRPTADALNRSAHGFAYSLVAAGHGWAGFNTGPMWNFDSFSYRKDRAIPALSNVSGNPLIPPPALAGDYRYNYSIDWSTPWNNFAGDIVDTANLFEIVLRSGSGSQTADVTPRRLQGFVAVAGQSYHWQNIRVSDNAVIQSGSRIADADKLIAIPGFQISSSGNKLRIVPGQPVPNQPPTVNAGVDQSVNESSAATLNGTGSDPENGVLTYQWSQVSGAAVTLNNASTASASFTAPQVAQNTVLTFRLTVTDNGALTATDDVVITVQDVPAGSRRAFPSSRSQIRVFADQLPPLNQSTQAQYNFAATHFAGTQKMILNDVRSLRQINPNFIVLNYRLALGIGWRSGGTVNGTPIAIIWGNQWIEEYANAQGKGMMENWFVHSGGSRIVQTDWGWYVGDPSGQIEGNANNGFKEFWARDVVDQMRATENDGIFADSFDIGVLQSIFLNPQDSRFNGTNMLTSWVDHVNTYGNYVAAQFSQTPEQFYFIPNAGALVTGWDNYNGSSQSGINYAVGDGVMVEGFGLLNAQDMNIGDWRLQMNRSLALSRANKIILAQPSLPDFSNIDERLFFLGCYLLIRGERTYLYETDGNVSFTYFPEYEIDLGAYTEEPIANIENLYQQANQVYRRNFQNGFVLVNPFNSSRTVNLGGTYRLVTPLGGGYVNAQGSHGGALSYSNVSQVTIPAYSARILLNPQGANQPPTANAGADQMMDEGAVTNLSGSGADPENGALTFAWSQTAGPSVSLNGNGSANTSFPAPLVIANATLTFQLTVTDTGGLSAQDWVNVVIRLTPDTDVDGLRDAQEVQLGTNPNDADSDDDGYSDGQEVGIGTNPLDGSSTPRTLRITADNVYTLYVNGVQRGTDSVWTTAETYLVKDGDTLAVRVDDLGGIGGFLAQVDGVLITDLSWKASTTFQNNWNAVAYNDSTWSYASELYQYGQGPWGARPAGFSANARWIWLGDANNQNVVYFRTRVVPRNALKFNFTCDNSGELYLNQNQIATANNWQVVKTGIAWVNSGDTIRIHGVDAGGIGSCVGDGIYSLTDGTRQNLVTDGTWQGTIGSGALQNVLVTASLGASPWGLKGGLANMNRSAKWIWVSDANAVNEVNLYKTLTINTQGASNSTPAVLYIAADDAFEAYVNGVLVAQGNNWAQSVQASVNLVRGDVIAIKAMDFGYKAGLLVESGSAVSNNTWKCSTVESAGWNTQGFDDTAWSSAISYGVYGSAPWGARAAGFPNASTAQWIWSNRNPTGGNSGTIDPVVYFRKRIEV